MAGADAVRAQSGEVPPRGITDVPLETVGWMMNAEAAHQPVTRHLGDNGGGSDGQGARITPDQGFAAARQAGRHVVAIDQQVGRRDGQRRNGAPHRGEARAAYVDRVDLLGADKRDCDRSRACHDAAVRVLACAGGKAFRIIDAHWKPGRVEDDGGRADRTGEGAPADLVDTGDRPEASGKKPSFPMEIRDRPAPRRPKATREGDFEPIPAGARSKADVC